MFWAKGADKQFTVKQGIILMTQTIDQLPPAIYGFSQTSPDFQPCVSEILNIPVVCSWAGV